MRGAFAALAALLALVGCGSSTETAASSTETTSSTSETSRPPTTRAPQPTPTPAIRKPTDELDRQFLAAIAAKGVPVDGPDDLTAAGYGVCALLNDPGTEDKSLINAAAWVMDVYEIPGPQASAVAIAGIDAYCPGLKP